MMVAVIAAVFAKYVYDLWIRITVYLRFDSNIQQANGTCEHAKVSRLPVLAIKYTSNSQQPQIQQ